MANERISMRKIRDIIRLRGKRARLSTDRPCPAVPRNAVATRPDDKALITYEEGCMRVAQLSWLQRDRVVPTILHHHVPVAPEHPAAVDPCGVEQECK